MNNKEIYKEIIEEIRWGDFNEKYGMNLSLQQQYVILNFIKKVIIPKLEEKPKLLRRKRK